MELELYRAFYEYVNVLLSNKEVKNIYFICKTFVR